MPGDSDVASLCTSHNLAPVHSVVYAIPHTSREEIFPPFGGEMHLSFRSPKAILEISLNP